MRTQFRLALISLAVVAAASPALAGHKQHAGSSRSIILQNHERSS
jgi:hypothetical protein